MNFVGLNTMPTRTIESVNCRTAPTKVHLHTVLIVSVDDAPFEAEKTDLSGLQVPERAPVECELFGGHLIGMASTTQRSLDLSIGKEMLRSRASEYAMS